MNFKTSLIRGIVLLILTILLSLGGILWFDYLGLISSRSFFSPVYSLFGLHTPKGVASKPGEKANLEEDRYAKRLLALETRSQELDKLKEDLELQRKENLQISEELNDRKDAIEEKEKSFKQIMEETDNRKTNIVQIAIYMNGMRPQNAVANLLEMDDQDIIDVLRAAEDLAAAEGKTSLVSYWFSLMPPVRAAEIQRKMANKPILFP